MWSPGQHQHMLRPVGQNEFQVLIHGIRRAPVPVRTHLLLGRNDLDELPELPAQVAPAALDVLDERLRLVLGEDRDLADAAIRN